MSLRANASAVLAGWRPDGPTGGAGDQTEQLRLRDAYLACLARHPDATDRACLPAHLTGSAIVLDPAGTATLLLLHGKLGLWVQPGGHCEPGDMSLAAAAERELREETGLRSPAVDRSPVWLSAHAAPCAAETHYDVQHLAIAERDADVTVSDESRDMRWFDVDALPAELAPGVRASVAAARRRISPAARTSALPGGAAPPHP